MHPIRSVFIISLPALMLAACAGKVSPPAISYDNGDFHQATVIPDPPKPVQIVTVPQPLPLPGQLMPPPSAEGSTDKLAPTQRVAAANKAALQEPTAHGYVNAIQVYPFTEGALYRLYAAPEQVTDIALQPAEKLVSVAAGDTVRWVVGNTSSGTGADKQVHILVKPFAPGLTTNLIIMTDRRSYHLELVSTDRTAMAAISWTYPDDQLLALQQQNSQANAAAPIADGVALSDLHFRYRITGDNPPWRPVRVFDDGSEVYIEFPSGIGQGEMPPLFVVGARGDDQLVNYRVRGNYYIVDRLFAAAELRLGETPQQVVRISRTDAVASATSSGSSGGGA
ncbi:MAG TPA: P-type conjugative transfer protein TrbG [Acidisoma sp.]|jgi:type IV secretion system protein VirB9|uniref:P-type conjugative transfer protein TrbG n=1 Tax=Acidisoma sp. TaxID=1872115 RepID=UPI002C7746B6|nr:P-type conjugative transfer protein TrbG [Acidisoma sp.]HTI00677.1 P-type conjugative transfer protein TrbG [Acidisoma sp.]